MYIVVSSIVAALSIAAWLIASASDGLRDVPRFLADPADRWRLLGEYAAQWPFFLALAICAAGCIWLLYKIAKRGHL